MTQRTGYQDRIIRNYYQNFDQIAVQRLSELVTDLYLAEGGKARTRLWQKAVALLEKLKVPAARIQHIEKADNPTLLANLVQELLSGKMPTGSGAAPAAKPTAAASPMPNDAAAPSPPDRTSSREPAAKPRSAASKKPSATKSGRTAKN